VPVCQQGLGGLKTHNLKRNCRAGTECRSDTPCTPRVAFALGSKARHLAHCIGLKGSYMTTNELPMSFRGLGLMLERVVPIGAHVYGALGGGRSRLSIKGTAVLIDSTGTHIDC
jgi:hypothetical protein